MNAVDLISLVLATGALSDAWRNGSVFEKLRPDDYDQDSPWYRKLLACDFCLGHHFAFWSCLIGWTVAQSAPGFWGRCLSLPLYALAAARAAWILNGFLPGSMQYRPSDGVRFGAAISRLDPSEFGSNAWSEFACRETTDANQSDVQGPVSLSEQETVTSGKAPISPEQHDF